jgi:putative restriction endonuclease
MNPSATLSRYIHQFSHLRMDKTGGWNTLTTFRAPHKPFLLLAILDLFSQARISLNQILV